MTAPATPPENTKIVQKAARKAKLAKALKANIQRRKATTPLRGRSQPNSSTS